MFELRFFADEWLATGLLVVGYAVYLFIVKRRRRRQSTTFFREDNTPVELQRATLYGSEEHISCDTPIPLKGTYDQLYQLPDQSFILTDTKTRKRPQGYDSDIIQLSAYKLILENSRQFKGKTIQPYGYIRLVCHGKTTYKKIDLMSTQALIDLYQRRLDLYKGRLEPKKADGPRKCYTCHQLAVCGGVMANSNNV